VRERLRRPSWRQVAQTCTFEQAKGFTLYATRTILSGGGDEILELARTNLRDLRSQ
jgi:hypothetical protein